MLQTMEIRKSQEVIDLHITFPISNIIIIRQHKITYVVFKCGCFIVNTNELYEDVFTIIISI